MEAIAEPLLERLDLGLRLGVALEEPREGGQRLEEGAAATVEGRVHAARLAAGEHEHRRVVDIVHVVHEHVAVRPVVTGDLGEGRRADVLVGLVRSVRDLVRAPASCAVVPPDVEEVQPVRHLVGGRTSLVERRDGAPTGAERRVQDHHPVRRPPPTRELGVAEQPVAERAGPDIQEAPGGPRVRPAREARLDLVVFGLDLCPGGAILRIDREQSPVDVHHSARPTGGRVEWHWNDLPSTMGTCAEPNLRRGPWQARAATRVFLSRRHDGWSIAPRAAAASAAPMRESAAVARRSRVPRRRPRRSCARSRVQGRSRCGRGCPPRCARCRCRGRLPRSSAPRAFPRR